MEERPGGSGRSVSPNPGPSSQIKKHHIHSRTESVDPDSWDSDGHGGQEGGGGGQNESKTATTTFVGPNGVKIEMRDNSNVGMEYLIPRLPPRPSYRRHEPDEELSYIAEHSNPPIPHNDMGLPDELEDRFQNKFMDKVQVIYSKYNFGIRKDTSQLAIMQQKDLILDTIAKNSVVIIHGFTGCGKTTQVPQFILDQCFNAQEPCNIVVTQPRRIAAISSAKRVCDERSWPIGKVVGYQVGMDRSTSEDTLLTYMTTEILTQKLINRKTLRPITHIIIDEVHERDLKSDLLLLVIKKILTLDNKLDKRTRIILMSATLDAEKFSTYFTRADEYGELTKSPIIQIPYYNPFKVQEYHLDQILTPEQVDLIQAELLDEPPRVLEQLYEAAVNLILSLDEMEKPRGADPRTKANTFPEKRGAVLVFLPGIFEIIALHEKLENKMMECRREMKVNLGWEVIVLHSQFKRLFDDELNAFAPAPPFKRKIVLSTNVAESSLTIPDIVYVVDFCLTKSHMIDEHTNFTSLKMIWASVSQCTQRKGRAGRVRNGKVYRMVPKAFYMDFHQDSQPEMLMSGLETVVLQLKTLKLGTPLELLSLALDPPSISSIERAVVNLKEYGALTILTTNEKDGSLYYDPSDGDMTYVGRVMNKLPIPPTCTRLILLGHCFGVMNDCIIIAAGLSASNSLFTTKYRQKLESYMSKVDYAEKTYSDLFSILNVYKKWIDKSATIQNQNLPWHVQRREMNKFEHVSRLNGPSLKEIKMSIEDLKRRLLQEFGIEERIEDDTNGINGILTKVAIAGAFYPNYFYRPRPDSKNEREMSKEVGGNDLFRTICYRNFPQNSDGKLYMKYFVDKCAPKDSHPQVQFEGQKVFVIFNDNHGDLIGPIPRGVYKNVKKRMIRDDHPDNRMEINAIPKDKEEEYLQIQMDKIQSRRMGSIIAPPLCSLPSVDVNLIKVRITHVESPSQFWVVLAEHSDEYWNMHADIQKDIESSERLKKDHIFPNSFCLAKFQADGQFYRARIESGEILFDAEDVLVKFIDWGNHQRTKRNDLYAFTKSHIISGYHEKPGFAIEARLSEIKPPILGGSVWSDRAISDFKFFVDSTINHEIGIYSIYKSVIWGKLFGWCSKSQERPIRRNINEEFVRGFQRIGTEPPLIHADPCYEQYFVNQNNLSRELFKSYPTNSSTTRIDEINQDQRTKETHQVLIEPPKGAYRTELKGAFSPLELGTKLSSYCQSSRGRQVQIDSSSVNSVLLDHEPTAQTSRLVIASFVGISDKTQRMIARETTLMPAIPGLTSLMSITFAPRIELRIETKKTKQIYTGAICGLGCYNNIEGGSSTIFPDHDMEIIFDVAIDDQDIHEINKIRHLMNLLLREEGRGNFIPIRNQLRTSIISMLKKDRVKMNEEIYPEESYIWNQIQEPLIHPPSNDTYPTLHCDIFPPHSTPLSN